MAEDKKKIICPDCETENPGESKKCVKCSLPLSMEEISSIFDFGRVTEALQKARKREEDRNRPVPPPKKKGLFK